MLVRAWRKGSPPHALLVGTQTGTATVDTVWRFLRKLKMDLLFDLAISLLGIYPENPEIPTGKSIGTRCSFHLSITVSNLIL